MFAYAGSTATSHPFGNWSLLFARQPEPDLEFEEDLAEENPSAGNQEMQPGKPPKKKGTSPIMWVLLLILLGIGGYFVMDPDGAMQTVDSLLGGEQPAPIVATPPPAPRVAKAPGAPAPAADPNAPAPAAPSMGQAPPPMSSAPSTPASTSAVSQPVGKPVAPAMPAPPAPMAAAPASPIMPKSTDPLYGEGQRVTVSSAAGLTLSQDSAGKVPGPAAKPGSPMVIMDGDLQPAGWVYQVRTETGAKGWVPEKLVKAMP